MDDRNEAAKADQPGGAGAMPARLRRTDDELREQSGHVLWEFRQLMRLAMHIHQRQVGGVVELADPLDAAALESFCIHARALVEFLWRDRCLLYTSPSPRDG